jgi:hypothetical protein
VRDRTSSAALVTRARLSSLKEQSPALLFAEWGRSSSSQSLVLAFGGAVEAKMSDEDVDVGLCEERDVPGCIVCVCIYLSVNVRFAWLC